MGSSEKILSSVVSAIEQTRVEDFIECHEEFHASGQYLANSIEVRKFHSNYSNHNCVKLLNKTVSLE